MLVEYQFRYISNVYNTLIIWWSLSNMDPQVVQTILGLLQPSIPPLKLLLQYIFIINIIIIIIIVIIVVVISYTFEYSILTLISFTAAFSDDFLDVIYIVDILYVFCIIILAILWSFPLVVQIPGNLDHTSPHMGQMTEGLLYYGVLGLN